VQFVTVGVMIGMAVAHMRIDGGWRTSLADVLPSSRVPD